MSEKVRIVEVGPRDGLQNEKNMVPALIKIALIEKLAACGHSVVEATSFVSPKWVPQLADAAEVFAGIAKVAHVSYPVLVPNFQGYERARGVGAEEVAVFAAASEAFSAKNTNATIAETLQRFEPIFAQAKTDGVRVRGYVSCVAGCPYQGAVSPKEVAAVARKLFQMGCYEVSLGDTIGVGTPASIRAMLQAVLAELPASAVAGHYHDTYGQAVANIYASLDAGLRCFDASVAGLGGCPYAKGATGNAATEDVVYLLHGLGLETGVDLDALCSVGGWISTELSRANQSRVGNAILKKRAL
jgi:hydroxymethylglutaryl-CoA lyase